MPLSEVQGYPVAKEKEHKEQKKQLLGKRPQKKNAHYQS